MAYPTPMKKRGDAPLSYIERGLYRTCWEVTSGRVAIGSIRQVFLSKVFGDQIKWKWTLRLSVGLTGLRHQGRAHSFERAKAEVDAQWRTWLEAADLTGR